MCDVNRHKLCDILANQYEEMTLDEMKQFIYDRCYNEADELSTQELIEEVILLINRRYGYGKGCRCGFQEEKKESGSCCGQHKT